MVLHQYKIDIKLDLVLIIQGPNLQIFNINYYNFHITIVPIPISYKPITMYLLSLKHKVK